MNSPAFEKLLVDALFIELLQSIFLVFGEGAILLWRGCQARLRTFMLFNGLLFGWSILGDILWNHLTAHKLAVLDDAPVWTPVLTFGQWMLDHAAGGHDGWQRLSGTTMSQLRWLWIVTVTPVWLLASLCFVGLMRARSVRSLGASI